MDPHALRPQRLTLDDLDRLLGGELSPEARAVVEAWRADPLAAEEGVDGLEWALDATFQLRPRSQEELLRLASEILAREAAARPVSGRVRREWPVRGGEPGDRAATVGRRAPMRWLWSAGVAAAIVAVTVLGWRAGVSHVRERVAQSTLTYTTGNGERAKITLPDGSTVSLNVASRLDVPADYAAGNRTVRLTGEALFTVSHQAQTGFAVIAGGVPVRVLGTSFMTRHYATDTATTVAVQTGKVGVRSVVVTAAQQVAVGPAGMIGTVRPADASQFSFAAGVLTLKSVPFPEAIQELDRWYDADIRLGDPSLRTQRVTGECAAGSLADLTNILELTFNVRVVRNGRVLTLFPR